MGTSRMGFDLRTKAGRSNFNFARKHKAYRVDWKLVLGDTLLPLACKVLGHRPYDSNQGGSPEEWACKRCHHYIAAPVREEPGR